MMLKSAALKTAANLENSAVAIGLEKVGFHSSPKEGQCQILHLYLYLNLSISIYLSIYLYIYLSIYLSNSAIQKKEILPWQQHD